VWVVVLGSAGGLARAAGEAEPAPAGVADGQAKALPEQVANLDQRVRKLETPPPIDNGDTAWMLTSTGLVLLMVPGLALFYGGMVRRKNVLGTMMQSMVALGLIGIQWVLLGYALAFGASQGGWIGWSSRFIGLNGVLPSEAFPGTHIPVFVHCMYQGMFAIITPALISGALAERVRFGPYCLFILLWATLVYDPLAHWVWAVNDAGQPAGWLGGGMKALDFAGGTVVHISAGFAALAAILVLRPRRGYPEHAIHPNSMVLTLTGAGLLWFGWFGFNGGSALGSGSLAGMALAASQVAAAAAALSWVVVEWLHRGKPTGLGLASGVVAGLVAVTPDSGYVSPLSALAIGLAAGVVCYAAVCLKPRLRYDDSLDAFGVHGVGGFLGALLTGVFASKLLVNSANGNTDPVGNLAHGVAAQFGAQATAAVAAAAYAFVVSLVLVKVIDRVWGFNLTERAEGAGLDHAEHGEAGFNLDPTLDEAPEKPSPEPRPARVPPDGRGRFAVVVDGPSPGELMHAWSALCQPGTKPPAPEFRRVYPYFTTVRGNRFHFRGGDPDVMRDNLRRLFEDSLHGPPVRAQVEG
jgi:Amt family ammonium transporter